MTYSRKDLHQGAVAALGRMLEKLGSEWIKIKAFDPDEPEFKDILPTTWDDLVDAGLLHRYPGFPLYGLTGSGWIAAMKAAWCWETEEVIREAGCLSAALKRHVGGRQQDTSVAITEIAAETGPQENWIRNAIESHLIRQLFRQIDAEWDDPVFNNHILIPRKFGQKLF